MTCVRLYIYCINEDCDTIIDPITLSNEYHDIVPLVYEHGVDNMIGYLPVVEPFEDVQGTLEIRNAIVQHVKENDMRRSIYNIERRQENNNNNNNIN